MENNGKRPSVASDPDRYEHVKSILQRYPDITADEDLEVLNFLRKGPMLDRALLSGAPEVQRQLAQFTSAHEKDLSLGAAVQFVVGAIIIVGVVAAVYFLWGIGV